MPELLKEPVELSTGVYLQIPIRLILLDDAIIRSNEAEEVLTFGYRSLGNRFIIPWRKIKGKLRRLVLECQRGLGIEPDCSLKNDLCCKCPTCFLFGATGETSSTKVPYNILSRVYGETFISETTSEAITPLTQNAVDERTLKTGQALMTILTVPRETVFRGVVTLKDPTPEMAAILIHNLQRLSRIGARSVEWGRAETAIDGVRLSDREELSAFLAMSGRPQPALDPLDILKLPAYDTAYKTFQKQVQKVIERVARKAGKDPDEEEKE
ncbi:MAG: type I-D CRISPR-associated protein Cas7/Csc2 [Candidatus Riflebacteria bacterium]|nr:type I-D CRISPR-associated protein Cas7/Csc2 [Candidatus Riflebacteria bacterium]